MNQRKSGILLHVTSLPSSFGIGDLGPSAYRFVDFLVASGQKIWQILPLNPSGTFVGSSPYASYSAFAGNPLLISPELLQQDGLVTQDEVQGAMLPAGNRVDYPAVIESKTRLLVAAYNRYQNARHPDYERFCRENRDWLDDYGLFVALKQHFEEVAWVDWPAEIRDRSEGEMKHWRDTLADRIERAKVFQFLFFRQWSSLKDYCNGKSIQVFGDMPIYVSSDSVDVWSHPELFKLDENRHAMFVSGAPPDYFSETGQRWGSPVYRWDVVKRRHFNWWLRRIGHNLKLFDMVRLDHFRGFVAYWEIPASEETAINGKWVDAPAVELFDAIKKQFPHSNIVAEDLGLITPDVREVMEKYAFPGMKILLFAFGGDLPSNPYIPHNYDKNCVVYTGTHDNNTIQGWFHNEASQEDRQRLTEYLGGDVKPENLHWDLIRVAMASVANLVVVPMQD
ncbi:MAG TPA: 4-alpha-glucanotransferase, partial [Acidobacteriota bacterium]|nr:4-alpha-glucanotransferase [Acidobacteriota bacterium]